MALSLISIAAARRATELGITVTEADVTQAEQSVAAQNQLSPEQFRRRRRRGRSQISGEIKQAEINFMPDTSEHRMTTL